MVKYCMTPLLMELKLIIIIAANKIHVYRHQCCRLLMELKLIIIIAANKIHVYRHQRRRLAQNLYLKNARLVGQEDA